MNLAPSRRWFRFSLRTGFILLTVLCAWVGYEVNWIRQRREQFASKQVAEHVDSFDIRAPGLLWLFGETGHRFLIVKQGVSPSEREELKSLFSEAQLNFVDDWIDY